MLRRPHSLPSRAIGVALVAFVIGAVVVACGPVPQPSPSAPPASSAPSATPTESGPELKPDGTASDNLPLFTAVAESVWATDARGQGRAYVDGLIAAGFDRAAMQVTQDVTTVGNAVESLQFSVRWGDQECLIGQAGPSTGQVVTVVMPQLAEGRCLIGTTRSIDW